MRRMGKCTIYGQKSDLNCNPDRESYKELRSERMCGEGGGTRKKVK